MKKILIVLVLLVTLIIVSACGRQGFFYYEVSDSRVITGRVEVANPGDYSILAYLTGGGADDFQHVMQAQGTQVKTPYFPISENGRFTIPVTEASAQKCELYIVEKDADYSSLFIVRDNCLMSVMGITLGGADVAGSGPEPFILLKDDGAPENRYKEIAYMGSDGNGNDKSMSVTPADTSQKKIGNSSMKFSYTGPKTGSHWAGMMLLYEPGVYTDDPGDKGPDLTKYTKLTFYVKGGGGTVKFFLECDGAPQASIFCEPNDEWQLIELALKDSWSYNNIPFGWACNESNPDVKGGKIEFWVDNIRFE